MLEKNKQPGWFRAMHTTNDHFRCTRCAERVGQLIGWLMTEDPDALIIGCMMSNDVFSDECEAIRKELYKKWLIASDGGWQLTPPSIFFFLPAPQQCLIAGKPYIFSLCDFFIDSPSLELDCTAKQQTRGEIGKNYPFSPITLRQNKPLYKV